MSTDIHKLDGLDKLIGYIAQESAISVLLDMNGNIIFANKPLIHFLGYDNHKIIGISWIDNFVPPKYRETVSAVFKGMLTSNILTVSHYINPVVTYTGEEKIVYWWNSVIRDERGNITYVISHGEDITDRRQLEKALLRGERDKVKILNSLTEPVIYQDMEYRILWVNDAALESLKETAEKIIGRKCYRLFHKRNTPCTACPVKEAKNTGKPSEVEITRYDGRIFRTRGYPVFGEGKKITGAIEIGADITGQKQTENNLSESESKYHLVADNIVDIIVVFDMNLKMTYVSPSASAQFGYDYDELLTLSMEEALPPDQFKIVSELLDREINKAIEQPEEMFSSQTLVVDVYKKDRTTTVPLEARMSFLRDEEGAPIGILGVARDISERKKAEQDLIKSYQKLQKALESSVESMAIIGEMRDPYTAGHQRRVMRLAVAIATELNLSQEKISAIRIASMIHDIGKISVPAEILSKPGKLNELEFNMIKNHPRMGYDILSTIEFLYPVAEIVYQHHERIDGSGYPRGLKGNEIVVEAKVLMVADVVEAMASHRPYREALGVDRALEEIRDKKGLLYDEHIVDTCISLFKDKGFDFE
jgi:PAS domain S-box-containing protein